MFTASYVGPREGLETRRTTGVLNSFAHNEFWLACDETTGPRPRGVIEDFNA